MSNLSNTAFNRYAPFIQEFIYKKGWSKLYSVQNQACEAILDTNSDIILTSGTATGKTEAVLFPILTDLKRNPSKSVSILYIGPLKALINDQFKRISELLENSNFPVWPWHGDISQNIKDRAKKIKKGIIQITPESLEALLIKHPDLIKDLFSDLRYIIIDEIHSLMGTDRGIQVKSQIERIIRLSKNRPRLIGLSATLGDYYQAREYFNSNSPQNVLTIGLESQPQAMGLRVESFLDPLNKDNSNPQEALDYLYDRTRNNKALIFTNSRKEAESLISQLKSIAQKNNDPDNFYIHHGSISKELRKETEQALKESSKSITTIATYSLELGIDIGSLDQTIQIGAPFTCNNFIQRLGRSGRITGRPLMRFINYYQSSQLNSPEEIPWELLRTIAIIELYRKDKWIEPFFIKQKPFSILIHQTLSTLASYGELKPSELARFMLTLSSFKNWISLDEFKQILKELIHKDIIQQLEDDSLIIGLKGEKIINHYSFYSVFADNEEYRVFYKGKEIGTLMNEPDIGESFFLAGSSWKVVNINSQAHLIEVQKDSGSQAPEWTGSGIEINTRVIDKINEILNDHLNYPYLSESAQDLLDKSRNFYKENQISKGFFISQKNTVYLFPCCGTREMRTLKLILKKLFNKELKIRRIEADYNYLKITSDLKPEYFLKRFAQLKLDHFTLFDLFKLTKAKQIDKYDYLLPESLLRSAYILNYLNITDTNTVLQDLINKIKSGLKMQDSI